MGWLAAQIVLALLGGALSGRGPVRKALGLTMAVASCLCALANPSDSIKLKAFQALAGPWVVMQNIRIARTQPPLPIRVWQSISTYDVTKVVRVKPAISTRLVLRATLFWAITAACLYVVFYVAPTSSAPGFMRWAFGVVGIYATADAIATCLVASHRLIGLEVPKIHDNPLLARSIMEFWGRRWNLIVGQWLHEYCYRPLAARRHPFAGVVASFAASAFLHWYLIFVPLGLSHSLVMTAFFLIQIPLIAIERKLRLATKPSWAANLWTIGSLVLISGLFVDPFLRLLS
ncbi:MAG: hypothetical protein HY791_07785 [Deltaproteobacteria bacterium]|nr:hypothetical protein [Deltaproteobacteria bacterium]